MKKLVILGLIAALSVEAKIVEETWEYGFKDQPFEGFLVYNDKVGKAPGVLVVHDWMGLTNKTKERARSLAKMGYVVFAADIYGKGVRPSNSEEAGALAGTYKKDRKLFRERLQLALNELNNQKPVDSRSIAAIGYCFGGTGVVELARSGADIKGVVSFHGGLDSPEPELGKNIKAKVLALHGADDPYVPAAKLAAFEDEMRKSQIDWQLIKYGNAVHSFTDKLAGTDNSKGAAYNEEADRRSWEDMKDFFKEILATKSGPTKKK